MGETRCFTYVNQTIAYSNFIKTWKKNATKAKKRKEQPKSKSAKSKKHKSTLTWKTRGKQGKSKRGNMGTKMDLSICISFACILLFRFTFFFCFFPGKKQKQSKIKAKKQFEKAKYMHKKCKWTNPFFFPFFSLFDVPFFPHLFCFRFFSFEVVLFDFQCVFLFFAFFQF